ncbi:MAG: hypothetical protein HY290_32045 [Planctomycetia bacterium]|nr:hypothetical protein [Planctomycetia bacterium]
MRQVSINGKAVSPQRSSEVVSRSAILILSGALIGTAIANGDLTGLNGTGFYAGIAGLLAFFALDLVAQGSRKRVVRRTLAAVDSRLSTRLKRDVERQSPMCRPKHRLRPIGESSYLTVTTAARC